MRRRPVTAPACARRATAIQIRHRLRSPTVGAGSPGALIGTSVQTDLDEGIAQEVGRYDVEAVVWGLGVGEEFVAQVVECDIGPPTT